MKQRPLLDDAFFASFDRSVCAVEDAETLPPECYVSEAFFAFEKQAIFDREWLCIGREAWATKPGDYFTATHVGEPVVAVRGHDGVLRAFSNVCQHRAMLVAEGRGNARSLLCQYHHWAYGLDGKLIGAPAMERARGFDKTCVGLPELKVEIWLGFVFINFDNAASPLAPRLGELTEVLSHYDLATAEGDLPGEPTTFAWNWKVMMENNNDGYHANKLHAGPLHNVAPSALSVFPTLPADTAGYFRLNGTTHQDAAFNPTHRTLLPIFPALTMEERNRLVFGQVPPTLSLVILPDQITYMILAAVSADEVEMTRGWLVAPGAMQQPMFRDKLAVGQELTRSIVAQDLHVDARVQIGLKSRFAVRGRYSWQESAQRELNRWLVTRYQRAWREHRDMPAVL